jgi:hypothetical protein
MRDNLATLFFYPHLSANAGKPAGGRSANLAVRLNPPSRLATRGKKVGTKPQQIRE